MGKPEIERYLSHLAVNKNVAVATQSQALNVIVFLYKKVLNLPVADDLAPVRSKKPVRLPVVLSTDEMSILLDSMGGINQLMARIIYGAGIRLMELVHLRVKDIDFSNAYLVVRDEKDGGDRTTLLGESIVDDLKEHLVKVRQFYDQDVLEGRANVYMPNALARKYPNAPRSWDWQYAFP